MNYYTYKLNLFLLNILDFAILIFLFVLTYFLTGSFDVLDIKMSWIVILIFWLILHEILHGIGFIILGKVKVKNVIFGAELEKGIFYCMCKEKISKLNILISLVFPLFFIGIFTYIIGLITNNNLLLFLSIFNIAGAIGDIVMTFDILRMPKDIKYLDLDDSTSFTILSKSDLKNKKYLGLILDDSGVYTSSLKAKDYKRLKVSKTSIIILAILILLIIVTYL